tara:strand:+ start:33 stop:713 length:681 start_codon:yes stop_codon:yes gene_type:complete
MGQNSQEVAYSFGQMGSAFTNLAQAIVPPKNHVIVAIQFIDLNTPTVLTPEKLDTNGPGFPEITGGTNVTAINADNTFNHNGIATLALTDNAGSNIKTVALSVGANAKVKPGQFVVMVNATYQEDGNPAATIDAQTPTPIYNGPNARGVKVKSVDGANVTLEGHGVTDQTFAGVSPDGQALIFIDEHHGAGGIIANGQAYPAGTTIYGRWTAFTPSAGAVICYFGK